MVLDINAGASEFCDMLSGIDTVNLQYPNMFLTSLSASRNGDRTRVSSTWKQEIALLEMDAWT